MIPGEFIRKLQRCNRNIRIVSHTNLERPTGLYVLNGIELIHKCGIDNHNIPEVGVSDLVGHIIKRGWRTTIDILIGMRIIKRPIAEQVFNTHFGRMYAKKPRVIGKKPLDLAKAIAQESADYKAKYGGKPEAIAMKPDLLGDFAHEIRKQDPVKKPNFEDIKNGK